MQKKHIEKYTFQSSVSDIRSDAIAAPEKKALTLVRNFLNVFIFPQILLRKLETPTSVQSEGQIS
jgi:hypothetical protein